MSGERGGCGGVGACGGVVMGAAGMDPAGVLFATCVASALACFLMALLANLPIGLAPAVGHNFFFAFTADIDRSLHAEPDVLD